MRRRAGIYIAKLFVQRLLGLFVYLLGARWAVDLRSAVYFALYFAAAIVSGAVMYRASPGTLAERSKSKTDSPMWDKLLLGAYWLLAFFGIYFIAGVEAAKAPPPGIAFWAGAALQLPAAALALRAIMVNPFLESTARIQADRAQTVCKAGPYRIIRHPTYAAVLLWCASVPMIFGTLQVGAVSAAIAAIILLRTHLEDRMLMEHLAGYREYARETRYRIAPFIW